MLYIGVNEDFTEVSRTDGYSRYVPQILTDTLARGTAFVDPVPTFAHVGYSRIADSRIGGHIYPSYKLVVPIWNYSHTT